MDEIARLQQIIDESRRLVFFTGAGVSTESGIPDFRSVDGLYNQKYRYPPETIISHSFFESNPQEFYRFYRDRMIYPQARPNPAHLAMAQLEQAGICLSVVTQNIDGLHTAAGSKNVAELHGCINRNHCLDCHREYGLQAIMETEGLPKCRCGGLIKPDVVLYEEGLDPDVIDRAVDMISQADTLVVTGTSLIVYPAAGLINYFTGAHLVVINKSATPQDSAAELVIAQPVGQVMSQIRIPARLKTA